MLVVRDLAVSYGAQRAVQGISLEVPEGQIVTLLGANGAGKTSTLNAICGLVKTERGEITWRGKPITRLSAEERVRRGIVCVPEGRQLFPDCTVEENLKLGAFVRKDRAEVKKDIQRILDYFPKLRERIKQHADTLSGGEQQMLAIGRALMGRPHLLLLDEPSLGLAPQLVRSIFRTIKEINATGVTVILVEQDTALALTLATSGYVLQTGRLALSGASASLRSNPHVRHLYLGE